MEVKNYSKSCGCHYTEGESRPWYVCAQHFYKEHGTSRLQTQISEHVHDKPVIEVSIEKPSQYGKRPKADVHPTSTEYALHNPLTKYLVLIPAIPRPINSQVKHYWLYALKLEGDNFYVGMTSQNNPYYRIKSHGNFLGARWTMLHKPLQVYEVRDVGRMTKPEVENLEQQLTLAYMRLYGYKKVRGGEITYTGRIFKLGNIYLRGNWLESLFIGLLLMACGLYIGLSEL